MSGPVLSMKVRRSINLLLIVGILLALAPRPALAQELPGPVLWLKFDESAGATTFVDSSASGANGACSGATCPVAGVPGRIGQAAQFDGVDDRVTVTRAAPAGSYTLAAWVRNDAASWGNKWRTIFQFGDDAPWFGVSPAGQLTIYPIIFGGSVPLGKWAHVAYSWDGTASRLYIDGNVVQTNNEPPERSGGNGLGIGLAENGRDAWLGFLDDLRAMSVRLATRR